MIVFVREQVLLVCEVRYIQCIISLMGGTYSTCISFIQCTVVARMYMYMQVYS